LIHSLSCSDLPVFFDCPFFTLPPFCFFSTPYSHQHSTPRHHQTLSLLPLLVYKVGK
jgi:hypothetical protein